MFKKLHYNSPVILTLAFISLGSLILGYLTKGYSTRILFSVYRGSLLDPLFYIRLFGHILGHANWEHYVNNFLLILILGPMLEEKYGSKGMLTMITITALVTGLLNILFLNRMLLGASGIVFMFIMLSSFVNFKKGSIPLTFILVSILYIGGEFVQGVSTNDNISQFTHIAGGIFGGIFGFKMSKAS